MDPLETLFILVFAAVLLIGVAQKLRVPYPIMLILGGILIGFIPGLHSFTFDPNLVLLVFLPPVLYYASFGIAFREFQHNWKTIFSLALGLVVFTTIVIACIFKWLFPEFHWALAFAFGAIVSPPDAIAATTILKRFAMNPRLVAILEGESLVNDASAIVLYKFAVAALLAGVFSPFEAGIEFTKAVAGGVLVGFATGFLFQLFSKNYLEPVLGVVFSFSIPYITYIIAHALDVSGVLAVVVNGLIGSRILFTHHSSLRRVVGFAAWDIFIIFLNCLVFILIGLQLNTATKMMTWDQILFYTACAFLIVFAMIVVRMLWVLANASFYLHSPRRKQILAESAIIGWSGMRGIVSLAVAIALPYVLPDGTPLEGRNEVIFMTFLVILLTLVIPGLTLPSLIKKMKIEPHSKQFDEQKIRQQLAHVVENKLKHLQLSGQITVNELEFLKTYFLSQQRVSEMHHSAEREFKAFEKARLQVIHAQRKKLLELWHLQEIDDTFFTHLETELDMVEVHIARAELK